MLRRAFVGEISRRFRIIKDKITDAIVTQDVFGLSAPPIGIRVAVSSGLNRAAYAFKTNPEKARSFMEWLHGEVNKDLLGLPSGATRKVVGDVAWANTYIDSAYKRGLKRADAELAKLGITPVREPGARAVDIAFNTPFHADKVGMIYTRVYSELKGITDSMENLISQSLAESLAEGRNPYQIARILNNRIEKAGGTLAMVDSRGVPMRAITRARILARTEVIRAHHVATINTYREAGLEGVVVVAEWNTAGDGRVCGECELLDGRKFALDEIEGMIPVHPQCRCVALPYLPVGKELEEILAGQEDIDLPVPRTIGTAV